MAEDPKPNALEQRLTHTGMERPSFIPKGDVTGTEGITKEDITLPRLALAQSLSPELDDSKQGSYIEGLRLGDMFNTLTREVYGKGPLTICVLRAARPRYVEFIPRELGGGIKDPNVPPNDARTQWGPSGERPTATKFYDFVCSLLPMNLGNPMERIIAVSMKSTQLKIARQWNGLIKMRNAPVFAGNYFITCVDESNAKGKYKNYSVRNAGFVNDETEYKLRKGLYEALMTLDVAIEVDNVPAGDDDTEFPHVPDPAEGGEEVPM
jgi:hypothetical protein